MSSVLPHVSVFIPSYNDSTDLLPCLESLRHLDYPKDKLEIVVWDNASTDQTVKRVRQLFSEMEKEGWLRLNLVEWKKNEGCYIPYNLGQQFVSPRSEYLLGLDADVELAENVLTTLVRAAQEERVAAVGARSVYFVKSSLTSHGAGFVNRWTGFYSGKDPETRIDCDYVIGCCWLLNRKIFDSLGGLDPDYYINHWEVDYCLRAKDKGYRILYEPRAVARHKIPTDSPVGRDRVYYMYRNKLLVINKVFGLPNKWIALTCQTLLGLPKAIIDSFLRNGGYDALDIKRIIQAYGHGWMNRTGIGP